LDGRRLRLWPADFIDDLVLSQRLERFCNFRGQTFRDVLVKQLEQNASADDVRAVLFSRAPSSGTRTGPDAALRRRARAEVSDDTDLRANLGPLRIRSIMSGVATKVVRRWTVEEFFTDAASPTDDDVPIADDGRRLDTPEKVIAYVARLDDVIAAKEHADRPKDRDALPELRRLRDEASGAS
jgi:hypothetical protein